MFYLDGILLRKYSVHLAEKLKGRKIYQIVQNDLRNFYIALKNTSLHISLSPQFPIIYLNSEKKTQKLETPFLLSLKKYLNGATIESIQQIEFDRILSINLSKLNVLGENEIYTLQFELISKNPNLILLNEKRKILAIYKANALEEQNNRILLPNITYSLPKKQNKLSPYSIDEKVFSKLKQNGSLTHSVEGIGKLGDEYCQTFQNFQNYLSFQISGYFNSTKKIASLFSFDLDEINLEIDEVFRKYFSFVQSEDSVESSKQNYLKIVRTLIKKQKKIKCNIEIDLQELRTLERDKEIADILAANMYLLKSYMSEIHLFDFYRNCECTIILDPKLTPQKNIDRYYKLYNKKNRAIKTLCERIETIKQNIEHLEMLILSIELISTAHDIIDIQKELESLGLIQKTKINNKKKYTDVSVLIEEYENYVLYIGKNNLSNEKVTFQLAQKSDLWFHVQEVPSSHVILNMKSGAPTPDAITHAAKKCKEFSKSKNSANVSVDYTEKKFVRKQKNYKPCLVFYTDFSTIIV